jgi:hypothetical protein
MRVQRVVTEHNGKEIETDGEHRFVKKCLILSLYYGERSKRFRTREDREADGHFVKALTRFSGFTCTAFT